MAEYTKVFDNPYPDGWKDLPSEETPITASALQEHTDAIENIENYLEENPIGGGGTDVQWNQLTSSGTHIADITIDGETTEVFAPSGGGSGSDVVELTKAEYDALPDSKLTDGKQYFIKDYSESGSGSDYSEEEICVGTYMGKKRYVKICPVTRTTQTTANSWNAVASAPSDIERVIHIEFLRVNDALGTIVSQYSRIYNGNIELYNTFTIGATAMVNAHIVIEYTKTTD